MPKKKLESEEEKEPVNIGAYTVTADFEQRYIVEHRDSSDRLIEEVKTVSARKGESFLPPEDWTRDKDFERLLYMKKNNAAGATFLLPTGKRVSLPVKE